MTTYTDHEIIKISDMCLLTNPCKHRVEYEGKKLLLRAPEIIEIFRKHGRDIPDHFKKYESLCDKECYLDEIKTTRKASTIVNHNLYENNKSAVMYRAFSQNRYDIVDEMITKGFSLSYWDMAECLLSLYRGKVVMPDTYLKTMFKTCDLDVKDTRDELMKRAIKYGSIPIIEYLFERKVSVGYSMFTITPKTDNELRDLLISRTMTENINVTNPQHIVKLISMGIYDIFVTAGLVRKFKFDITRNIILDDKISEHNANITMTSERDLFEYYIKEMCCTDLSGKNHGGFTLPRFFNPIKSFSMKFGFENPDTRITSSLISLNDNAYNFIVEDNTIKFSPIDPLWLLPLDFCELKIRIQFNELLMNSVTSVHYEIEFENSPGIEGYMQPNISRVDDNTKFISSGGSGAFTTVV